MRLLSVLTYNTCSKGEASFRPQATVAPGIAQLLAFNIILYSISCEIPILSTFHGSIHVHKYSLLSSPQIIDTNTVNTAGVVTASNCLYGEHSCPTKSNHSRNTESSYISFTDFAKKSGHRFGGIVHLTFFESRNSGCPDTFARDGLL